MILRAPTAMHRLYPAAPVLRPHRPTKSSSSVCDGGPLPARTHARAHITNTHRLWIVQTGSCQWTQAALSSARATRLCGGGCGCGGGGGSSRVRLRRRRLAAADHHHEESEGGDDGGDAEDDRDDRAGREVLAIHLVEQLLLARRRRVRLSRESHRHLRRAAPAALVARVDAEAHRRARREEVDDAR